jgi:hypothetical protein
MLGGQRFIYLPYLLGSSLLMDAPTDFMSRL